MGDEKSQTAAVNHECLKYILSIYEKPIENVVSRIGNFWTQTRVLQIGLAQ